MMSVVQGGNWSRSTQGQGGTPTRGQFNKTSTNVIYKCKSFIKLTPVVQGSWQDSDHGVRDQSGTRTQPYGLRVQRTAFSTAYVKSHYLGDIVISRAKGDASAKREKKRAGHPSCLLA